jgi:hypothetical protein
MSEERVEPKSLEAVIFLRMDRNLNAIRRSIELLDRRLNAVETRGAQQSLPFDQSKKYQYVRIDPGQSAVVYDYDLDAYIAYIYYVGAKWYPNTILEWSINKQLEETVLHTYGNPSAPVSEPMRLEPPKVARNSIRWVAYNNDIVAHDFEVYHDGVLYRRSP